MSVKAALFSLFLFFKRLLVYEFSLSSEIIVQSASETIASNTKTRKKTRQMQNKQIDVNRLVFVPCFFKFFS